MPEHRGGRPRGAIRDSVGADAGPFDEPNRFSIGAKMSKSLARVKAALADAGVDAALREMPGSTRTAADAAAAAGCALDQIVKSIVFRGASSGDVVLFMTAGGNRVDPGRAAALAGQPLAKADAGLIRAQTGFAIGGVAPVGMTRRCPAWFDRRLLDFETVWAAAGTPRHVFAIRPALLQQISHAQVADFTQ